MKYAICLQPYIPMRANPEESSEMVNQMVDVARNQVHKVGDELNKQLALKMAMAQSINYGKTLSEDEMTQLIESLQALPEHQITPDGKKVMLSITTKELEKMFS